LALKQIVIQDLMIGTRCGARSSASCPGSAAGVDRGGSKVVVQRDLYVAVAGLRQSFPNLAAFQPVVGDRHPHNTVPVPGGAWPFCKSLAGPLMGFRKYPVTGTTAQAGDGRKKGLGPDDPLRRLRPKLGFVCS